MTTTLALDTAMDTLVLAVKTLQTTAKYVEPLVRRSDVIHMKLEEVLETAGVEAADVTHMVVTRGPGSFTGARVGLAIAHALELAQGTEIIPVTTCEALALTAQKEAVGVEAAYIVTLIEAAGADVFVQIFTPDLAPVDAPKCLKKIELAAQLPKKALYIGSAVVELADILPKGSFIAHSHTINPDLLLSFLATNQPATPLYVKELGYKKVG